MSTPWIPTNALPRAAAVTDALLAPDDHTLQAGEWADLARSFMASLRHTAARSPGAPLRIDGYRLARAPWAHQAGDSPFCWSPRTARRLIGVAALRSVSDDVGGLAGAVAAEEHRLIAEFRSARGRAGSLGSWLAGADTGTRAAVRAAAITWATRLWCALDFDRLAGRAAVGQPDQWWDCPGARGVCLRGRSDVAVSLDVPGVEQRWATFIMLGGRPGPTSRAELGLGALVAGLRRGASGLPVRALGYWPDCGRTLVVPIDAASLTATVRSVLSAAAPAGAPWQVSAA